MNFSNSIKRKVFLPLLSIFLTISFVLAPISHTLEVKHADAGGLNYEHYNTVVNAMSMISNAASAAANSAMAAFLGSIQIKEYVLDGIAWQLVNLTIQEMIKSTTKWVNSGFQGSPAFVTNLEGFLLDIADRVAGDFIYGSPLSFLCSPFKLNIQFALTNSYSKNRNYKAQCRLSGVVANMENFMNGNFLSGGWNGWYNLTMVPGNNPYSALFESQVALNASIVNAQGQEIKLLEFGKGFLSKKNADGTITTPGSVIETQLNNALGLPGQRLVVADELNELIGALFSQLASAALSGAGGLLGLTEPSYGSGDYFDRMAAERVQGSQNAQGTSNNGSTIIQNTIASETRYLGFQNRIISLINDASAYKSRTYPDRDEDGDGDVEPNTCHSGTLTTSLSNQLTTARRVASSTQTTITTLNVLASDYTLLESATTPRATITTLLQKYNVTAVPAAQAAIMDQFMVFQNSGNLHTINDLTQVELRGIPDLQTEIASFTSSIDRACEDNNNGG